MDAEYGARRLQQEAEWRAAQAIHITPDLTAAAASQLLFLASVDKHRALYEDGPLLRRAIHRYKHCWLPLLAEHPPESHAPLVVPLDCEWIWHCHRLNPVRYKTDCESVFGKILDNRNVQSTTETGLTDGMALLWGTLYPDEPFDLHELEDRDTEGNHYHDECTAAASFDYDLVAAVKRQSSFYYQVSRPTMDEERFLKAAVTRYKGFLHLIKRNREKSLKVFSVPTYDVDLIWHSHQLQPLSYCNDLTRLIGSVLEHDDTDSDRSKGQKLDVGFMETTRLWEETFGSRYWRAGAMYRGAAPSPVVTSPCRGISNACPLPCSYGKHLKILDSKFVEVFLEVVNVRNAPNHKKRSLFVSFGKNCDTFLNGDSDLNIQSETGKMELAGFRCEPTGDLTLTLVSETTSLFPLPMLAKNIGTISISLQEVFQGNSELAIEKWFELKPKTRTAGSKPIYLHVAASFTVPVPAPYTFYLSKLPSVSRNTCFSSFFSKGHQLQHWSHFTDGKGGEVIKMYMRCLRKKTEGSSILKQVVGSLKAFGGRRVLAEFLGNSWEFRDSKFILSLDQKISEDGHIFDIQSEYLMKLFPGRRLEFEANCSCNQKDGRDLLTLVQFSMDEPYGKSLALINVKTGLLKVNEKWFVPHGLILAFILWSTLKTKGYEVVTPQNDYPEKISKSNAPAGDVAHEKKMEIPSREESCRCTSKCVPKAETSGAPEKEKPRATDRGVVLAAQRNLN